MKSDKFLKDAKSPVYSDGGLWNLWYNPVPKSRPAKDYLPKDIPPEEKKSEDELSEISGTPQELNLISGTPQELDLKVDESQYQRMNLQQQLNSSLVELVDEDKKANEKDPNKYWEKTHFV